MSPAVTLHSLLSLPGRFKILNIIFPGEYELSLSHGAACPPPLNTQDWLALWKAASGFPAALPALSRKEPLVWRQWGRKGAGGGGQDVHLPEREGHVPQSSSTSHSPDLRLNLLLNGEAAW